MDLHLGAPLRASPETAYPFVADLTTYPHWLRIVRSVDPEPAAGWRVELEAGLGPLRRRKTVRMVRAVTEAPRRVRFEREELDSRQHPAWVLSAELASGEIRMHLHYAGVPPLPGLDLLMRREAAAAARRLDDLIEG